MIAALPMYDRAETAAPNDRFWALVRDGMRARGLAAPDTLTRGLETLMPMWTAPDLVFSQTCGFPYRTALPGQVTLIGTPDYGVAGCPPGYYRSVLIAGARDGRDRLESFDGAGLAYNDALSQSGWAAPQNHVAALGLTLRPALRSGSHRESLLAVAGGRAEIAALDAVTWSLLAEHDPAAAEVKVVGWTDPTPGLPYIAAKDADAATMFAVVAAAIAALSPDDARTLRLRGLAAIPAERYLSVPNPPAPAQFAQRN